MDKTADKFKGVPKGKDYCDKPGTACWYNSKNVCVNCGRPKGWRKLAPATKSCHWCGTTEAPIQEPGQWPYCPNCKGV